MTEPCASSTARLTMFSEAISSISWRCRPSSPCTAAAISGSASARVALKKESVAERALVIGEISPRPQVLTQGAVDFLKAVGKDPSPYHKARIRPRNCGSDQIFVPHMVDGGRGKPCPLPLYMRVVRHFPDRPEAGRDNGDGALRTFIDPGRISTSASVCRAPMGDRARGWTARRRARRNHQQRNKEQAHHHRAIRKRPV